LELSVILDYHQDVFSLNPTFVEIEAPETRSLLDQAQSGDAEAFSELCRAHETRLLRQAHALCGNASLAEELAQDTLVESWKCLHRYNRQCRFFTWLCAILLNRHRNIIREKRPVFFSMLAQEGQREFQNNIANLTDQNYPPDEKAQLREQSELVWQCIQTLSPKHQQVVYLRFYVDNSLEGIAAALGCSVGTVKSRLFNALDRLRDIPRLNAQFTELKKKGVKS
jgi:RNA polymerase sigma-70 factor (ECF subfamily)